jgi:hypothetical protein
MTLFPRRTATTVVSPEAAARFSSILSNLVLLDITAVFERGQKAENIVLVQAKTFSELGYAKFVLRPGK